MRQSLRLLLLVGLVAGCAKSEPSSTTGVATAAPKPSAPEVTADILKGATPATPPPGNLMSIPQRFESEAQHRPAHAVRSEAVVGALKKAGLSVTKQSQHLAGPFLAAYCLGIKVGESDMSVCEYNDADTASKGREASLKSFGTNGREIFRNGQTTLTVRAPMNDEGARTRQTAVNAFMALKAE